MLLNLQCTGHLHTTKNKLVQKCQQHWGWHWSRVAWTFWDPRTCSWRSPDFIVGLLLRWTRMPKDQSPVHQPLHLSWGKLASKLSSESMRCPWIKPGSRGSPGERAPGRGQWGQSLGKASLWFRKLYRQRKEALPQRVKDQRQMWIRCEMQMPTHGLIWEQWRGPRVWVTGPVDKTGKISALEKTWKE